MYATQTLELHKFFSLSLGPGLLDFVLPNEKKTLDKGILQPLLLLLLLLLLMLLLLMLLMLMHTHKFFS